jgi:anaerobic selenocysteine-containing dehydrogenase
VEDGKVVKVEGDPEHPITKGALCPRCLAMTEYLYHPDRIIYPMKRDRADRGKDKWERISWDEAIDIVADSEKAYCIRNGHPMMSSITGTGCQLSAMTAAFVTANPEHPLEAAAAAVCTMGYAGEIAHSRLTELDGNSSYRNYIIDAIYNMTPEMLEKGANYELR